MRGKIKTERLRKKSGFDFVFKDGSRWVSPLFVILFLSNSSNLIRLGIPVKKSIGKAVKRNKIKRLIRESFRLNAKLFTGGIDVVVLPFKKAGNIDFKEIKIEIDRFFEHAQNSGALARESF